MPARPSSQASSHLPPMQLLSKLSMQPTNLCLTSISPEQQSPSRRSTVINLARTQTQQGQGLEGKRRRRGKGKRAPREKGSVRACRWMDTSTSIKPEVCSRMHGFCFPKLQQRMAFCRGEVLRHHRRHQSGTNAGTRMISVSETGSTGTLGLSYLIAVSFR